MSNSFLRVTLKSDAYANPTLKKTSSTPPSIRSSELNEVLSLIREEKGMINERMRALKRSNDQYKQLCENYMKGKL